MKDEILWRQLAAFAFDAGQPALTFARRLARENGWSATFAERAIEEYRKFLYLASVTGHPVTPSDEVDQVWHLHLVYTRSYWDELCGRVLKMPLHHGPTAGGPEEDAKYRDWYRATLKSYAAEFGHEAPGDVWPPVERRFSGENLFQRSNKGDQISRPWDKYAKPAKIAALVMGTLFFAIACGSAGGDFEPILLFAFFGPLLLILVAGIFTNKGSRHRDRDDRSNQGCGGGGGGGGSGSCGSSSSGRDHGDNDGGSHSSSGCASSGCGSSGCSGGGGCGGGGD